MGNCCLGYSAPFSWAVGWDTLAWVRVPALARLLGGTLAWAEGDTYMRVDGGTFYPGVECPLLPRVNSDCVHRDERGEIVSSILLKGFQKLQIPRLFSIPLSQHKNK